MESDLTGWSVISSRKRRFKSLRAEVFGGRSSDANGMWQRTVPQLGFRSRQVYAPGESGRDDELLRKSPDWRSLEEGT